MARRSLVPLLLAAAACQAPAPEEPGEPAGWRSLFDGRTLAGWEGDSAFWRVEGGAIVGESTSLRPCERTTYLVSRAGELADFELVLSWRIRGGNSGVQFRSRAGAFTEVAGYQADLEAGPDWTGGLYEQDGRGVVARRGERVILAADGARTVERFADGQELLGRIARSSADGGWNELRLEAFGPRLTIRINGTLTCEVIDLERSRAARSGALALQLHQGEPMRVEFRDVRVRALVREPLAEAPSAERAGWDAPGAPHWIWADEGAADEQVAWFRRSFELPAPAARAEIWGTCDNSFESWLNEQPALWGDDWARPRRREVGAALRPGANELFVRAENEGGPAALALALHVTLQDGRELVITSDGSWSAVAPPAATPGARHEPPESGWAPAHDLGGLDAQPWFSLRELLAPAQPSCATPGSAIEVPEGFRVELLYSVPLEEQGSWVSLAVGPAGCFYASDQYGGLYRIRPPPLGSEAATRVERLGIALGEAHGLLWAFDALYAVVSGAGGYTSGLHRARDTDGDGELDEVRLLRAFEGDGEHGPHAVLAHPDGRSLVVIGGNHTKLPGPFERQRLPATWGEDVLLPPFPDPGGHAVEILAPGGWVVRTDPEGGSWELIAAGFRNAYDGAFDADGELFAYDSDMEWDVGMPWYRPTRVVHVVSGAEFGWRNGSSKWPAYSYDALPAAVDLELGSPTGVVFGAETRFPEPWRSALFACDWAYGRIFAVQLEPRGAGFTGRSEVFASGKPFPVTDVVVGPDRALYVTTGGRQTQSGLYRISWVGGEVPGASAPSPAPAPEVRAARERRRALEAAHGIAAPGIVPLALAELGDPDPFLRYAARIALESQDPVLWTGAVRAGLEPRAELEGLLALVRTGAATDAELVLERAAAIFERASTDEPGLDALRLLELALLRLELSADLWSALRERLDPFYPTGLRDQDRELLSLLVTLGAPVQERALAQLERAATQEERVWILYALRAQTTGWNGASAARFLAAIEAELAGVQGGASARGYVEKIRDAALEAIGPELASVVAPATTAAPAVTEAAVRPAPARLHRWTLAELEPALARVGSGRSFEQGQRAYLAASCHSCHRMNQSGENAGPDLTGAGSRYSPRDLLLALLEPSREVPDVWRDTEFWGEEQLLAAGRLEQELPDAFLVRDTSGKSVHLPRELVRERVPHPLSRMPESLLDALSEEEVLDLLAYVLAGGDAEDERF